MLLEITCLSEILLVLYYNTITSTVSTMRTEKEGFARLNFARLKKARVLRRHTDVAELRGIQGGVAATAHGEADIASGCECRVCRAPNGGPGSSVRALVGGDGSAAADETNPGIGDGAGATVGRGRASAYCSAASPAIGIGARHTHEDLLRIGGQRVTDYHAHS